MLWILTVTCFQFMGDYWLRHVRPDLTLAFATAIDAGIASLLQMCTGTDITAWSAIAQERCRLPIRMKGCGLRRAPDRRHAQYIGAAVQSVPYLVDRTDEAGCVTPGRLNLPAIVTLFGEGAFNHPCPAPWQGVLNNSRPAASITIGLRSAWSQLTTNF